jgi:thiol-disulfide isomerase/thioredoxin
MLWSGVAGVSAQSPLATARGLIATAQSVAGPDIGAADLRDRPVIVTFFASWCPPCTDEFAVLNDVRERYGAEALAIVALNVFENFGGREDTARMTRFLGRTSPQFSVVKGSPDLRALFGDVERIPTLIVFDADGVEVWRFVHEVGATHMSASLAEIDAALAPLLNP